MTRRLILCLIAALFYIVAFGSQANAFETGNLVLLNTLTSSKALPNGVEVVSGKAIEQVTALRDDVIRVRIGPDGQLPEDSSWAVLKDARSSAVAVTPDDSSVQIGFCTRLLCAHVERTSLRLRITDAQGNVLQEDVKGWPTEFRGSAFRLYKQMPEDEHYFGLGDKTGPLDRRYQAFTLWNTDHYRFQESTDPLYKSIPFFLAVRKERSIGVLLDSTWRSSFDFGKQSRETYSFGAEGGPIDYYVIYGPEPKQVLSAYGWLTGYTPLPPLWSLGFQQSRYSYENDEQLREVASRLRKDHIPADALYLDIDFQEKNRPFTVNKDAFPDLGRTFADLAQQKFHVVAITDLHIAQLPDSNYQPYDSGVAGDHFLKNPDNSTYVGRVWPGPSVFPDFTRQSTREWWGTLYKDLVKQGAAGFWNDMNEPSVFDGPGGTMPEDVQHRIDEPGFVRRSATHAEIHNVYGMENSRATYEGLLKLVPNQRPFVLTRATYAGGQRYAATWTGDNSSTWNHLRLATPMLLNLGMSGFAMSGADVGGFIGSPQPDLLTRWIEVAAFQPIDRDHSEKGTLPQEPWVHGPKHEDIRRRFIEERYKLLPYIYTATEEMSRTGVPIMRPVFLEFPSVIGAGTLEAEQSSQFLLGADILVAPSPYPDEVGTYLVRFPTDTWFDYWTGEPVKMTSGVANTASTTAASTTVTIRPTIETLPVYVRAGAIIPMQPVAQSTEDVPQGPLTLRVYPGQDCEGSLYLDDGKTMAYKQGDFLRMSFTCEKQASSVKVHVSAHEGSYHPWWKQIRVELYGDNGQLPVVTANGKSVVNASLDAAHHNVIFEVPDDGSGMDLVISEQGPRSSTAK